MPSNGIRQTGKRFYAYHQDKLIGAFGSEPEALEAYELAKRLHKLKYGERRGAPKNNQNARKNKL